MAANVNSARGEASLKIEDVELVLAATMTGLSSVSTALGCKSLSDLWLRLDGVEVAATLAGIEFLTVKGDWAEAIKQIKLKHFAACRVAFQTIIGAHLDIQGNDAAVEDQKPATATK